MWGGGGGGGGGELQMNGGHGGWGGGGGGLMAVMHRNHGFKQLFIVVIIGSCIILEVMRSLQKLHYSMKGINR